MAPPVSPDRLNNNNSSKKERGSSFLKSHWPLSSQQQRSVWINISQLRYSLASSGREGQDEGKDTPGNTLAPSTQIYFNMVKMASGSLSRIRVESNDPFSRSTALCLHHQKTGPYKKTIFFFTAKGGHKHYGTTGCCACFSMSSSSSKNKKNNDYKKQRESNNKRSGFSFLLAPPILLPKQEIANLNLRLQRGDGGASVSTLRRENFV